MKKTSHETATTERYLRCKFTDAELLKIGKELAEHNSQLVALENDKKRVNDDFKARASSLESKICIGSNGIQSGYEFRNVPCTIFLDDPEAGKKRVVRDDTGEMIGIETMTPEERQKKLPLEGVDP